MNTGIIKDGYGILTETMIVCYDQSGWLDFGVKNESTRQFGVTYYLPCYPHTQLYLRMEEQICRRALHNSSICGHGKMFKLYIEKKYSSMHNIHHIHLFPSVCLSGLDQKPDWKKFQITKSVIARSLKLYTLDIVVQGVSD